MTPYLTESCRIAEIIGCRPRPPLPNVIFNIFQIFQSLIQRKNRIPTTSQHIPVYLLVPETSLHAASRKSSYTCSLTTFDCCLHIYQTVSDDCSPNPGVPTSLGWLSMLIPVYDDVLWSFIRNYKFKIHY